MSLACRLNALDADERRRRSELQDELVRSSVSIRELADGFAVELPPGDGSWRSAAEFVTLERRCCPFVTFRLETRGTGGPVELRMTGGPGVKEFLASVFQLRGTSGDEVPPGGSS